MRAWHHTYGLPVLTTNCSNNYGPYHFPEKLIPLMIVNALAGKNLPVYGDGMQIRDWLYVRDHCSAIRRVLAAGRVGETYNVGGWNEKPTSKSSRPSARAARRVAPRGRRQTLFQPDHLRDRPPGPRPALRDRRAQDRARVGLAPAETFETGIRKTVEWYLANRMGGACAERQLPRLDRQAVLRLNNWSREHEQQRHHPGRWLRYPPLPVTQAVSKQLCRCTTSPWSITR